SGRARPPTTPSGPSRPSSPAPRGHALLAARPPPRREFPHCRHSMPTPASHSVCALSARAGSSTTCSTDMTDRDNTENPAAHTNGHSDTTTVAATPRRRTRWLLLLARMLLAVAGGTLLYLSYAPRDLWWLAPLAFTCLGLVLDGRRWWAGGGYGIVFGATFN